MIQDPTGQLLQKMAGHDLHPKTIAWDGRKNRFPGAGKKRGKDAWYIAYPDRKGAHFGDFSTGVKKHFMVGRDKPPSIEERRKWAEEKERRDKEKAAERAKALEQVRKVFAAAEDPDPKNKPHPYLFRKGIEDYGHLRISTHVWLDKKAKWQVPAGLLLVPMWKDGKLVNIQRIWPKEGMKPKYWPGAETIGARHVIGMHQGKLDVVYICEGWATGYTIHKVTGQPVVVAFSAGGLRTVAEDLRKKRDPKRIILAADNDRWSKIVRGGGKDDIPNVGVTYASRAAKEAKAEVAIPDFEDLEGKPTDFDDLRQREGEDAVRKWLDPNMAAKAVIVPAGEGDTAELNEGEPEPGDAPQKKSGKVLRFYDNELMDLLDEADLKRWLHDPRRGWLRSPKGRWNWKADPGAARLRNLLRILAEKEADNDDRHLRLRSATVNGAVSLIQARVQHEPEWDSNPMIAGLPNGHVLDLTTGDSRPARRDEFVSRRLGVAPDPDASAPKLFLTLVNDMVQDSSTVDWFLAWIAYTLTGHTFISDHIAPILAGAAGAGKTTLSDILKHLFGSYVAKLPADSLVAQRHARERHPEWMIGLDGARLGIGTEIPERGRVNTGLFKELTGGEDIVANLMRMNSITFTPTTKYLLYGNAPPTLPGWDDGLKRRIVVVPCHAKPKAERVEGLAQQIVTDEGPAIMHYLASLAATCYDRHCEGRKWLPEPSARSAKETADLFDSNDPLGQAVEAVFNFTGDPTHRVMSKDIVAAVSTFYDNEGFTGRKPSSRTIAATLKAIAKREMTFFDVYRTNKGRGWRGIQLKR